MESSELDKDRPPRHYTMPACKFNEFYLAGGRGREAMSVALEKAHEQLTPIGVPNAEHGGKLRQYLAHAPDQTVSDTQHLDEEARQRFDSARSGAGSPSAPATVAELTGNAPQPLNAKTKETLAHRTGEMASAGTLTCQAYRQKVLHKITGHVSPYPKCTGTLFNKGYRVPGHRLLARNQLK